MPLFTVRTAISQLNALIETMRESVSGTSDIWRYSSYRSFMTSYNRIAEGVKADLTRELGQEIHIDLFRIEMVPTSSNAVVPKQKEYFDMVMTSARSLRAFLNTSLDHGREMAQTGFALSEKTPQELARLISENFSLDELKLVCFDIDLDPEQVPGDTKDAKIIGLIGSCKRRGLLAALILSCQRHRPNATWPA